MSARDIIDPAEDITAIDFGFYVGTHHPGWLWREDIDFPLFVCYRRIAPILNLKPATSGWALDSGAFSELKDHGRWTVDPIRYVQDVDRIDREVGRLEWAAPQDWMCEPW